MRSQTEGGDVVHHRVTRVATETHVVTGTSLHVLIIDDVEDDALLAAEALRQGGYAVSAHRVDTAATLDAALTSQSWDLLLCDYRMPQFSGLEALALVRQHGRDVPFILMSGAIGEETAVAAMKAGAHDYIMKDNPARLVSAVRRELREVDERRQRRRAEEDLRASEACLRTVIANAPITLFAIDADGRCTLSEGKTLETIGFAPGQLVGQNMFDLYKDIPASLDTFHRVLGGEVVHDVSRIGGVWDSRLLPVWDAAGHVSGLIGVTVDVRERVEAEDALRASEARFRALSEHVSDIVAILETNGTIRYASPSYARVLGYQPEDLVGTPLLHYTHPDDREQALSSVGQCLETPGGTSRVESRLRHADGSWIPLESIADNRTDDPAIGGVVVTSRDITMRRHTEEALTQRTRELERSNAELQQFAYVASHDLQEPLRTITSYLQLLQRRYQGKLDAEADTFIGYATDGAARMSALIKAVLAYSRIRTHGTAFGPADCDALVRVAVSNLEARIVRSGARIVHEALPTVQGDATQLGQLFQNLIANALTFTRPDVPPVVWVEAERQGDHWLVRVVDNGIGIPPEHATRVFSMFQRLHSRDTYEGTGIGLSVCQRIVERHGGRIWVESAPAQGAAVLFTLPVHCEEREDTAA